MTGKLGRQSLGSTRINSVLEYDQTGKNESKRPRIFSSVSKPSYVSLTASGSAKKLIMNRKLQNCIARQGSAKDVEYKMVFKPK